MKYQPPDRLHEGGRYGRIRLWGVLTGAAAVAISLLGCTASNGLLAAGNKGAASFGMPGFVEVGSELELRQRATLCAISYMAEKKQPRLFTTYQIGGGRIHFNGDDPAFDQFLLACSDGGGTQWIGEGHGSIDINSKR